jgi:hypothetical protein
MGGKGSGRKPAPCGTPAAYRAHWKRKETCQLCKTAWADYLRSKRKPKTHRRQSAPVLSPLQKHRELVRNEKLLRGACMDCGLIIDDRTIVCIDFDHRDPALKSFTISQQMGRGHCSDIIEEMAKCDAVCRNCHAIRTHEAKHYLFRRDQRVMHETLFDT